MRVLVQIVNDAGGRVARDAVRGRVHGGLIVPAVKRGLIEEDGSDLILTERGVAVATGSVEPIPESARIECVCGLLIDGRDEAQIEFLRLHRAGDSSVKSCPGSR